MSPLSREKKEAALAKAQNTKMKKCEVCGNTVVHHKNADEFFRVGGDTMLVEQVPAQVCDRCGEATFSRETVEKVRKMMQEHSQPTRKVEVETFAFA